MRERIVATASPGWLTTLRIIEWSTRIRDTSGSGAASRRRANVSSVQLTSPSGRLARLHLAALLGIVARLRQRAGALDDVLGRLHDHVSRRVEAGAPRATGDLVELARLQQPVAGPSNFARPVNTTVRIGTLMPTPSVSVPQITFSSPVCASCSTRRR